jgi:hypothetical protein
MTTEEKALRELRLGEIQRGIQSRRFGLRAMKRTLLLTILYGAMIVLSSIRDHSPFDGIMLFCGLLVIIFTVIEEHDAHMKLHLAEVIEFIKLTNEKQRED